METDENEYDDNEPPDFDKWLPATMSTWTWDWPHQLLIYRALDRITQGKSNRLMIFMPPRHSKSETVTVRYTAWRMIRDPRMNLILGCYNQRLANRFSRKIRRVAGEYTPLSKERRAVDEWETAAGGTLCAVGVGGGVTGYGAGLIVIDDPVKNRAHAESIAFRESMFDWFNDDIYTRLEPNASIILIQTRWHENDLAGRLLKEMADGGEKWDVLSLPALAEPPTSAGGGDSTTEHPDGDADTSQISTPPPAHACVSALVDWRSEGEALCPERYDREALLRIKKKIGSYAFAALYQQSPVPRDGGLFKRKWFTRIIDRAPEGLRWFRAYDLAVSTKTSADFTASFRCAKDAEGNLYIADGYHSRIEFPEQRRYVIERMNQEKNTAHGIEEALHGRAFVQELRREIRLSGVPLKGIRADADKFTRALAWAALAEEGKVILVRGSWIDEFLDEVCRFPDATHDDQVDAVSLAVKMMAKPDVDKTGYGF
jgi:predicted phage terminase large subunit-like protein